MRHLKLICCVLVLVGSFALPLPAGATDTVTNGRIAFTSNRTGRFEIYSMDPDGNNVVQLTHSSDNYGPAFSSDGRQIAFANFGTRAPGVYVMRAGGSHVTRLTRHAGDGEPAFSTDATRIVFTRNSQVYTMHADGTHATQLTSSTGVNDQAVLSPDGSHIAFQSTRDAGNREIYVMDANGDNQTRLTNTAALEFTPAYSPDGNKITYTCTNADNEVCVMDANGDNQTDLTNNAANDGTPVFSPDGTKIAFSSDRPSGDYEIFVMDANGANPTRITTNTALDYDDSWGRFPLPVLRINNVKMHEGAKNTTRDFVFTVSLSGPSPATITVDAATADKTAKQPSDYMQSAGTLTFVPGDVSETFTVTVNGDHRAEPDETFLVRLSNQMNATIGRGRGVGTIKNDD